jgi:hypothetical protein
LPKCHSSYTILPAKAHLLMSARHSNSQDGFIGFS